VLSGHNVPSYKHELLADLFERSPDLAWRIMAPLVGLSLEDVEFECKSEQLPELREFRPDRLALVRAKGSERALAAAVIEVQLKWSDDKPSGWLCHLALRPTSRLDAPRSRLGHRDFLEVRRVARRHDQPHRSVHELYR
jgi:hypothetical protein